MKKLAGRPYVKSASSYKCYVQELQQRVTVSDKQQCTWRVLGTVVQNTEYTSNFILKTVENSLDSFN